MLNSLSAELEAYPNVNLRYYFQETDDNYSISTGCPPYSELDFSDTTTWCLQQAGRRDAMTMLGLGQEHIGPTFKTWLNDKQLRKTYPKFRNYLNEKFDL